MAIYFIYFCESLFEKEDFIEKLGDEFETWNPNNKKKLLLVVHFV